MTAATTQSRDLSVSSARCQLRDPCVQFDELKSLRALNRQSDAVLRAIPDIIFTLDHNAQFLDCNHERTIFNIDTEACLGNSIYDIFPEKLAAKIRKHINKAQQSGAVQLFESPCSLLDQRHCEFRIVSVNRRQMIVIIRDITRRRQAQKLLQESEAHLRSMMEKAKEANIALKVLLRQKWEDEEAVKKDVLENAKRLLEPLIGKLKHSGLSQRQTALVEVIESNLKELVSPFIRKLSFDHLNLTPQEIQLASFIRQGKTSKEIASTLGLSVKTVDAHRNSIRKKLGISNKKINLQTFLQTLQP